MPSTPMIIEVVLTRDEGIERLEASWVPGLTAEALLRQLNIPIHEDLAIGVYGRRITLATVLENTDRLEVYQPLKLSPTERRKRQAAGKALRRPVRSPRPRPKD